LGSSLSAEKTPKPDLLSQGALVAFALFVSLLVLVSAFFIPRNGDVDEPMMYNPSYMLAHFGKLTFPSYPFRTVYDDPVIMHPPIHLGSIGLLMRLGLTWYYSEAIPSAFFLLVAIVVIVTASFPPPVKLGLLYSIGFLMFSDETFAVFFGTRPEGELYGAWFTGLLLLESGRIQNWSRWRLFAGAFVLTWASGVHYYACTAFVGVGVYIVWAGLSLGWSAARSQIVALCTGGCLFGVPYLLLYLLPYWHQIMTAVQLSQGEGGIAGSLKLHQEMYRAWSTDLRLPLLARKIFDLGIPLLIPSTALLLFVRSTRGLALAALSLQLFVLFFAPHKLHNYLVDEVGLFAAALSLGLLSIAERIWRRILPAKFGRAFSPGAALCLTISLLLSNPVLRAAKISSEPRVHEGDLARAATRTILGPQGRVAGRLAAWYTSGAAYWFDIERDMLSGEPYDPASFFANFDAVADYLHQSDTTNKVTISSLYADGTLKLRGFYLGETNEQFQIVLLSTHRPPQVVGYATQNNQLYRFAEHDEGDYEVLTAVCPAAPEISLIRWHYRPEGTFSATERLPNPKRDGAAVILTVLTPQKATEPASWIRRSCRLIGTLHGSLLLADNDSMIASLRRNDTPIHFPRMLEQVPGYAGVGLPMEMRPPQDPVRLNSVLDLGKIEPLSGQASVDHGPPALVKTPSALGAFAAAVPLAHAESVSVPCWVQLRLKVLTGEVGFAAHNRKTGIVARTSTPILKSNSPQDVVLKVPDLHTADSISIFNENDHYSAQVEVLDAAVLVTPQDYERARAKLSALR
jgi:hypothetical protein